MAGAARPAAPLPPPPLPLPSPLPPLPPLQSPHAWQKYNTLRVTSCCCGCSLKTGTIIIGTLHAMGGLAIAMSMTQKLLRHGDVAVISGRNHGLTDPEVTSINRLFADMYMHPRTFSCIMAAMGALQFVLSVMLIYGANNERPRLMKPWLVYAAGVLVLVVSFYGGVALLAVLLGSEGVASALLVGMFTVCGSSNIPALSFSLATLESVHSIYSEHKTTLFNDFSYFFIKPNLVEIIIVKQMGNEIPWGSCWRLP